MCLKDVLLFSTELRFYIPIISFLHSNFSNIALYIFADYVNADMRIYCTFYCHCCALDTYLHTIYNTSGWTNLDYKSMLNLDRLDRQFDQVIAPPWHAARGRGECRDCTSGMSPLSQNGASGSLLLVMH